MYHFFTLRRVSFYFFFVYHKIIFLTYASVSFHFILYNFNLLQFVLLFYFILLEAKLRVGQKSGLHLQLFCLFCFAIVKSVEFWLTFYMNNYYLLCLSLSLSIFAKHSFSFILSTEAAWRSIFPPYKKVRCFYYFSTTILIVYCVLANFFIFLLIFVLFNFPFPVHDAQSSGLSTKVTHQVLSL